MKKLALLMGLGLLSIAAKARPVGFSAAEDNPGFQIFRAKVYPILQNSCVYCHGVDQHPLFAVEDAEESYRAVKGLVDANNPENSRLWIRSKNNHCRHLNWCGTEQPELLQGLRDWLAVEGPLEGKPRFRSQYVAIPAADGAIEIPAGELVGGARSDLVFRFTTRMLTPDLLILSGLQIKWSGPEAARLSDLQVEVGEGIGGDRFVAPNYAGLHGSVLGQAGETPEFRRVQFRTYLSVPVKAGETEVLARLSFGDISGGPAADPVIDGEAPYVRTVWPTTGGACVITSLGKARCWGANASSETGRTGDMFDNVGDATGEMGTALTDLLIDEPVVQVTGASSSACAVSDSGKVYCWGSGYGGRLGNGSTEGRSLDTLDSPADAVVDLGTAFKTVQVTGRGGSFYCALSDAGRVKCWGSNYYWNLGLGDDEDRGDDRNEMGDKLPFVNLGTGRVVKIDSNYRHSCALFDTGQLKCWGYNSYGQLGLGDIEHRGKTLSKMGDALPFLNLGTAFKVKDFSVGDDFSCALSTEGQLKCWGANSYGQLGLGDDSRRGNLPTHMGDKLSVVDLGQGFRVAQVACGESTVCALSDAGGVKCWGGGAPLGYGDRVVRGNAAGQMGEALPLVDLGTNFVPNQLRAGKYAMCAANAAGLVKCWGDNSSGELGQEDNETRGDALGEMGDALHPIAFGLDSEWSFRRARVK